MTEEYQQQHQSYSQYPHVARKTFSASIPQLQYITNHFILIYGINRWIELTNTLKHNNTHALCVPFEDESLIDSFSKSSNGRFNGLSLISSPNYTKNIIWDVIDIFIEWKK